MKEQIKRHNPDSEFYIQEGCYITELSNSEDDPNLSVARARVLPGVTTRWHRLHATSERYVVLSGTGVVEIGELPPQDVRPGDVVLIQSRSRQRISNTGDEDLIFLAICTPRFLSEAYEDLSERTPTRPTLNPQ